MYIIQKYERTPVGSHIGASVTFGDGLLKGDTAFTTTNILVYTETGKKQTSKKADKKNFCRRRTIFFGSNKELYIILLKALCCY